MGKYLQYERTNNTERILRDQKIAENGQNWDNSVKEMKCQVSDYLTENKIGITKPP